jgi:magnesium-protoporphyrin O-methyltransferase
VVVDPRRAASCGIEETLDCARQRCLTDKRAPRYPCSVARCCDPRGCDDFFGDKFARSVARRYRKRGLDKTSKRIVAFLERSGIQDATVLEIGGGVGEIQLELLKRGAASAVNLELSPAYDAEARRLLREAGIDEGRVVRRRHDIAEDPVGVEPADVVVLHRVVCCYPDYERLLGAAASHARRALVFSHPPRNLASRTFIAMQNAALRLGRKEFRTFAHPPSAMLDVCRARGLAATDAHRGLVWQVEGLSR